MRVYDKNLEPFNSFDCIRRRHVRPQHRHRQVFQFF